MKSCAYKYPYYGEVMYSKQLLRSSEIVLKSLSPLEGLVFAALQLLSMGEISARLDA